MCLSTHVRSKRKRLFNFLSFFLFLFFPEEENSFREMEEVPGLGLPLSQRLSIVLQKSNAILQKNLRPFWQSLEERQWEVKIQWHILRHRLTWHFCIFPHSHCLSFSGSLLPTLLTPLTFSWQALWLSTCSFSAFLVSFHLQ